MSALIVIQDLHIMMIEFVIDKLFVPKISDFDSTVIRKTTVMFRIVDDWLSITPQCKNKLTYNHLNNEEEYFNSGISIVFAIPATRLQHKISNTNIDVYICKETSKYFEMQPCQNVGLARIPIDSLFNGIIKDLKERKDMQKHFNYYHPREPISRSMKDTYMIIDEHKSNDSGSITIYTRLNYFGKSIITEIESFSNDEFHVREETCESNPYQCREVSRAQLEIGCWDGDNNAHSPSVKQKDLICMDDVHILQGVKAKAQGALNGFEQRGITMNTTDDMGKSKEFTSDNVGEIAQGISMRLSKDGQASINRKIKELDETDAAPQGKETIVKNKKTTGDKKIIENNMKKKKKKKKKKKMIMMKMKMKKTKMKETKDIGEKSAKK